MRITPVDLSREYKNARSTWPFITDIEKEYGLPPFLLYAVGSRETNLTNEVGDFGHGHGMFQLDDRSHTIPPGFDLDVKAQAIKAASMLQALIAYWPKYLRAAVASYNAGTGGVKQALADTGNPDSYTANHDYGQDVLDRMTYLQKTYGAPPQPKPPYRKFWHTVKYVVRQGDTLSSIGARYKMSWYRLYNLNKKTIGSNPDLIYPGEVLIISRKWF